jgi:2-polyprenyl-6-methoxyphenol hydroxylase-like FAD-dependent oxidoreductase
MTKNKRIVIIGAGVAGLAFATLASRQGHEVTVFERRSQAGSEFGAGVTLWPNAVFVLDKIGVMAAVDQVSGKPKCMTRFDLSSNEQSQLSLQELNRSAQFDTRTILRRDLMRILFDAAKGAGANVIFGQVIDSDRLSRLEAKFDMVVGADGRMNSIVRQSLGVNTSPVYQGFLNVIGISEAKGNTERDAHTIRDYWGDGERFGIVPIDDKTCFWAAGWAVSEPIQGSFIHQSQLIERFKYWPKDVLETLHSAEDNVLNTIYVHDLDPIPSWYRDRLIMIGDAAHAALPTSGQGACQALEDAWWLSKLIGKETSIATAFGNFQTKRFEKTVAIQSTGRQIAQTIFHTSAGDRPAQAGLTQSSIKALTDFWMSGLVPSDY